MKILYFSPRACWPTTSGARLRDFHLARELVRGGVQLTYLGFDSSRPLGSTVQRSHLSPLNNAPLILVGLEQRYSITNLIRGALGPWPIGILNYSSPGMRAELRRVLATGHFDAVQLEGVHLASYINSIRQAQPTLPIICDWHNVESEVMDRYADNVLSLPRRLYARRTATLLRRMEDWLLANGDEHLVCSTRERDLLRQRVPSAAVSVVGNGVDVAHFDRSSCPAGGPVRRQVVFVGSMDYHANIDAVLFFAREVWPLVRQRRPELTLAIVGSSPTEQITALARSSPSIFVSGSVPDVRCAYTNAVVVVAPIRVGSGTRLKILEAMAAGVPVVSTTRGAEGLALTPGRDVLIADTAAGLASAVASLEAESVQWKTMAQQARRLVAERYDWTVQGATLRAVYAHRVPGMAA